MEVSTALLVAIMFVTILGMGIGNILTSLAEITRMGRKESPHPIHISWMILLLLVHLRMFWFTVDVLAISNWRFIGFLGIIVGPILLFFSTGVLLAGRESKAEKNTIDDYFKVSSRFFVLVALIQPWTIAADFSMGRGLTGPGMVNLAILALTVVLASSKHYPLHVAGAGLAWILTLLSWLLHAVNA